MIITLKKSDQETETLFLMGFILQLEISNGKLVN